MKLHKIKYFFCLIIASIYFSNNLFAQDNSEKVSLLTTKEQHIVSISAFTSKGNLVQLKTALNTGLDAGLTINEIKEILIQLYAYNGFPRSLNALNTFIDVLKDRKARNITDTVGNSSASNSTDKNKLQLGTEIQTKLIGQPLKAEVYDFAPVIDKFLKEHLFADIFGNNTIDWRTREIVTIASLASLGNVQAQLRSHFKVGIYNGLTAPQLNQLVSIINNKIGLTEGKSARHILQDVLGKKSSQLKNIEETENKEIIFPTGDKITNNNFTGTAYLKQLIMPDSLNNTQVGNVTFEPGARSNWHYHPGGQILLAIDGTGYYQEKGQEIKVLKKGDVVKCPPNVVHWHGASPDDQFIQVAITSAKAETAIWLQKVTDKEYNGKVSSN